MFEPCPCGTGKTYIVCCGPLHGGAPAPDAEALMRARYAAYARANTAYLMRSWAPETRPPSLDLDPAQSWTGLEIHAHTPTGPDTAEVHFTAHMRKGDQTGHLTEQSRFRRDAVTWVYLDGGFA